MGRINVLSFAVANLIAAGEVVDRPSSVIKELLENAIDSGATKITVEIQNGGVTYMRVTDNGCGMTAEELPVAIRRHATSKIKNAEDLDGITTLGFRGEALAAIASVSELRIISRPRGAREGAMLSASAGNILGVTERVCAEGTSVIVENLFANVPARRKFLKKDMTEALSVSSTVEKIALSRPDIAFRFITDGKVKIETVGNGKLGDTVYALFGRDFASKLIRVLIDLNGVRVHGYIGRPDNVRANRNYQNFFINGRYVKSKTALAAVEQAYTSYIASEKFPCCVLFIKINPGAVDVNVHPAKLEVKFSNEKPVFEAVYYAVRDALEHDVQRPSVTLSYSAPPRVSDRTTPIMEENSGLKPRQIREIMYTQAEEKYHLTAEEYLKSLFEPQPKKRKKDTENDAQKRELTPLELEQEEIPIELTELARKSRLVSSSQNFQNDGLTSDNLRNRSPNNAVLVETTDRKAENAANAEVPDVPKEPVKTEVTKINEEPVKAEKPEEYAQNISELSVPDETRGVASAMNAPPREKTLEYRIIGEAFNEYVIVERDDRILLIDKHAAHERIIFEQLKAKMNSHGERASQLLMIPLEVMMTSDEIQTLIQYKHETEAIGFEMSAGKYTLSVTAIPDGVSPDAAADMLTVMADRLKNSTGTAKLTRDIVFEKALYQASCKAAVKAGREYPPEYIEWIVDKLMELPDITVCPHGRPVAMELTRKNLDYQFERS